jgi:lysophospholipase L1-like esterase
MFIRHYASGKTARCAINCMAVLAILAAPLRAGNSRGETYLALGDSVAFGYNPNLLVPGLPLPVPSEFIGYPETAEQALRLLLRDSLINAACPGETSSSFITGAPPDNGCNGPQGFKAIIGLHTNYTGSQLDFALKQLKTNPRTNVVTLGIGGNDLLLLKELCTAQTAETFAACIAANAAALAATYETNLAAILTAIRHVYSGRLILVNVYAPDTDPTFTATIAAFDTLMARVGAGFGVRIADAFTAFQLASALAANGDPCAAGLLIRLPTGGCDVHPSPAGRDVLAATVLFNVGGIR